LGYLLVLLLYAAAVHELALVQASGSEVYPYPSLGYRSDVLGPECELQLGKEVHQILSLAPCLLHDCLLVSSSESLAWADWLA
jgi:hypothetical protein